jgi:hypothetical protein
MKTSAQSTEQPKTECPFCGNVWQEHTLNEIDGCMAIMHVEVSAALAKLKGKPSPSPTEVEICPVCNKLTSEHSDDDQRSCVAKWRKHPRGATGLELQRRFLEGHFENEEPDPVKRAQLRAQWSQSLCPCGKARGDHTQNEILACAERNRPKPW